MRNIELKCTKCNSWNMTIVHSYFSYYLCEDCGACYQEHTMHPFKGIRATFNIQGKEYTRTFTIDEIKSVKTDQDLVNILTK